jgi:catechol 2,3-dioxygenase-like lactoylglutathione lyase family enzyme
MLSAIDHVQLAMPPGEEETARAFFVGVLGMTELTKPPVLARRGGCWFQSGGAQLHLGVEKDFRPAKRAHPAFRCAGFDALVARLQAAGVAFTPDDNVDGVRRGYIADPFGNRIELIATQL